jgi:hypothetical protein
MWLEISNVHRLAELQVFLALKVSIYSRLSARNMWSLLISRCFSSPQPQPWQSHRYPYVHKLPKNETTNGQKRVATIKGGIAGSLVAYQLYDEYQAILTLDITVYETAFQVRGRINSTWVDDRVNGYTEFIEAGAWVFSANDVCIQAAIDRAWLRRKVIEPWY